MKFTFYFSSLPRSKTELPYGMFLITFLCNDGDRNLEIIRFFLESFFLELLFHISMNTLSFYTMTVFSLLSKRYSIKRRNHGVQF